MLSSVERNECSQRDRESTVSNQDDQDPFSHRGSHWDRFDRANLCQVFDDNEGGRCPIER
jgi:hypothetical protein